MADEPDNIVLEHLRAIRRDVSELRDDVSDMKSRLSAQEEISGQILVMLGALGKRFDRNEERLSRIERRLDLVEA